MRQVSELILTVEGRLTSVDVSHNQSQFCARVEEDQRVNSTHQSSLAEVNLRLKQSASRSNPLSPSIYERIRNELVYQTLVTRRLSEPKRSEEKFISTLNFQQFLFLCALHRNHPQKKQADEQQQTKKHNGKSWRVKRFHLLRQKPTRDTAQQRKKRH